jgi:hypothetical protein
MRDGGVRLLYVQRILNSLAKIHLMHLDGVLKGHWAMDVVGEKFYETLVLLWP